MQSWFTWRVAGPALTMGALTSACVSEHLLLGTMEHGSSGAGTSVSDSRPLGDGAGSITASHGGGTSTTRADGSGEEADVGGQNSLGTSVGTSNSEATTGDLDAGVDATADAETSTTTSATGSSTQSDSSDDLGSTGEDDTGEDCQAPEIRCEEACIDPRSNERFCGATAPCTDEQAGIECPKTSSCLSGQCRAHELVWSPPRYPIEALVGSPAMDPTYSFDAEGRAIVVFADSDGLQWTRSQDLQNWTPPRTLAAPGPDIKFAALVVRSDGEHGHILWQADDALLFREFTELEDDGDPKWQAVRTVGPRVPGYAKPVHAAHPGYGSLMAWARHEDQGDLLDLVEVSFDHGPSYIALQHGPAEEPSTTSIALAWSINGHAAMAWRAPDPDAPAHSSIRARMRSTNSRWYERVLVAGSPQAPSVEELSIAVEQSAQVQLAWTDRQRSAIHFLETRIGSKPAPSLRIQDIPDSANATSIRVATLPPPQIQRSIVRFSVFDADNGADLALRTAELRRPDDRWHVQDFPCTTAGRFLAPGAILPIQGGYFTYTWSSYTPGPRSGTYYSTAWSVTDPDVQHCDSAVHSFHGRLNFIPHPRAAGRGLAVAAMPPGGLPPGPWKLVSYELSPRKSGY